MISGIFRNVKLKKEQLYHETQKRNLVSALCLCYDWGPMLTQHHHPEATGDASGHAWCCASCVLGLCLMTRVPLVTAPRRAPCHYPAHNRCFFMYLLHLLDVTVGSLRTHDWTGNLCLAFNLFFEVLKVTYHLQLFKILLQTLCCTVHPCTLSYTQAVCTSPPLTLVLPIPQKGNTSLFSMSVSASFYYMR